MTNAGDRAAAVMGRQLLMIVQLEAEVESLTERNTQLQAALKDISTELAGERSKGGQIIQEPPTSAELSP